MSERGQQAADFDVLMRTRRRTARIQECLCTINGRYCGGRGKRSGPQRPSAHLSVIPGEVWELIDLAQTADDRELVLSGCWALFAPQAFRGFVMALYGFGKMKRKNGDALCLVEATIDTSEKGAISATPI